MKHHRSVICFKDKYVKFCLLLVVSLCSVLSASAKDGDQMKLEAGKVNSIWSLNSAFFVIDFSEAKVEGKTWDNWLESKGNDYVKDWPIDIKKLEIYFMSRFNKKTNKKGGLQLQNDNPDDRYKFVIHLDDIDMGSIGGGVVASAFLGVFAKKSGGVNLKSGYIDIIDQETNTVVCRLSFKDVKGDSGLNMSSQLILALEDLYDEIFGYADRFKDKSLPEIQLEQTKEVAEPEPVVAPTLEVAKTTVTQSSKKTTKSSAASSAGRKGNVARGKSTSRSSVSSARTTTSAKTAVVSSSQKSDGEKLTSVKLKSGATVKGVLKSFDPLTQIVLIVAGQEVTIPMDKVDNVESADSEPAPKATCSVSTRPSSATTSVKNATAKETNTQDKAPLGDRKLLVTETADYPQSITIDLGGTPIELLLVKGGRMNMGYDGDHSMSMNSEPVHEVRVTSFYMSKNALTCDQISKIFKDYKHDGNESAMITSWDKANKLASIIASKTGKPFRLPTEAEWEYAASGDLQNVLFSDVAGKEKEVLDWCSDYYDDFPDDKAVLTDPTGPLKGDEHVIRAFNYENGKYQRNNKVRFGRCELGYVRLVIKAADY